MSEFDSSWEGWQFITKAEDLVDRLADPLGGVALVETGIDIHPVLHAVAAQASEIIRAEHDAFNKMRGISREFNPRSEAYHQWSGSTLKPYIRGATSKLRELSACARALRAPINEQLMPKDVDSSRFDDREPRIVAARRSRPTPNHIDLGDISTLWFGATKPALRILHNGEWMRIDDAPPAHAFVWRGDSAHDGTRYLDPTKHTAPYRSMHRRVIALA